MRLTPLVVLGMLAGCTWVDNAEHAARLAMLDRDGDGYLDAARGGDDCDDDNPAVHPGAEERCATPGDDDCDGLADADDDDVVDLASGWTDADGDGFGEAGTDPVLTCPGAFGLADNSDDCDDSDAETYPGAPEECPGYGPDRDCSDEPQPCELFASQTTELLQKEGFGVTLAGHGDMLAAVVGTEVVAWNLAGGVEELTYKPKGTAGLTFAWDVPEDALVQIDAGAGGVVMGTQDAGAHGVVGTVTRRGSTLVVEEYPGTGSKEVVGFPVGWVPSYRDEEGPWPASVNAGSGRTDLLVSTAAGWSTGPRLSGGVTALTGGVDDIGVVVAVRKRSGGGSVTLYSGTRLSSEIWDTGAVAGAWGDDLGVGMKLADLNDDGSLDVVVTTSSGLGAWEGPVSGYLDVDDAWWFQPTPGAPSSVASGDFNGDGVPDVAVGVPDADEGAGTVWVFPSGRLPAGTGAGPRLRVNGSTIGEQLGTSIAFADVNGDGIDDLVMGAPGEDRILLVLGGPDW